MSSKPAPASTSASATTSPTSSACARLAISGTTPPKRACRSTWLDTTLERMSWPSSTIAAAVSSQLVSMPRIAVTTRRLPTLDRIEGGLAVDAVRNAGQLCGVLVAVDVTHPHDERVLVRLRVVPLAHADRAEAEVPVHRLR